MVLLLLHLHLLQEVRRVQYLLQVVRVVVSPDQPTLRLPLPEPLPALPVQGIVRPYYHQRFILIHTSIVVAPVASSNLHYTHESIVDNDTLYVLKILQCKLYFLLNLFGARAFFARLRSTISLDFLICSADLSSDRTRPIGFPPYRPLGFPFFPLSFPLAGCMLFDVSPRSCSRFRI